MMHLQSSLAVSEISLVEIIPHLRAKDVLVRCQTRLHLGISATIALGIVPLVLVSGSRSSLAQEGALAPGRQAGNLLSPMMGGALPVPNQEITITWDPRFKQQPIKAALVGAYYVVQGDIIVGTVDDVAKARRNSLALLAGQLRKADELGGLGLPEPALAPLKQLIDQVAALPQEKTQLKINSPARTDLVRFLSELERFQGTPGTPGIELPGETKDAIKKFREGLFVKRPTGTHAEAPPPPPQDPGAPTADAIAIQGYLWPRGEVPYYIDPSYEPYRTYFEQAIRLWTSRTSSVSFRPYRTGDTNYLYVRLVTGTAGSSSVGMMQGGQYVNLIEPGRFPPERIAHELGHALGLFHEQSRPDVANYLTIIWANILQDWQSQFFVPTQPYTTLGSTFDYFSIMLYDFRAGSIDPYGRPEYAVYQIPQAMVDYYRNNLNITLNIDTIGLGNVKEPSDGDVKAINSRYSPGPLAPVVSPAPAPPLPGPLFPDLPTPGNVPAPVGISPVAPAPSGSPSSITITITIPPQAGASSAGRVTVQPPAAIPVSGSPPAYVPGNTDSPRIKAPKPGENAPK